MRSKVYLDTIVNSIFSNYAESEKVRGVFAFWDESRDTLKLTFFYHGEVSENELDEASTLATGIICGYPDGFLEDDVQRLDRPIPLPEGSYSFKRNEK